MAKLMLFFCLALLAVVFVTAQGNKKPLCSALHEHCTESSQCCRHLICMSYRGKCVQKGGLIIPGQDKRPLSPFSQD